ncbi:threonylcarbamoyladenosine biosynthesis protein TsaE [Seminavis robusta]|uniref:tRNA threonylcarbamoyladenosine biosynthesis protein TsaE n=1 Tax=Seminavis robusta TaxID=568900 RepID=A0A9N8EKJ1_9STRA|nr:threonylcarbamoyladenosine biosynthesis protein TsaE [Seminavis robusta]|eukprot:Sro1338_g264230.1 threonylcarbamoyladenosine biosynthesis protein TsaE (232) ;mRNA; f:19380-20363
MYEGPDHLNSRRSHARHPTRHSARRLFPTSSNEDTTTNALSLEIPTAQDTEEVGALFAAVLLKDCFRDGIRNEQNFLKGTTIFLDGDLGAGKTAFARGFLRSATGDDNLRVTSPTFLLVNVYPILGGSLEIHHMDVYRLKGDPEDFKPLNLDHVFAKHVSLIEWPQRLGSVPVPEDRLDINIRILSDDDDDDATETGSNISRMMTINPRGPLWEDRLKEIVDEGYLEDLIL